MTRKVNPVNPAYNDDLYELIHAIEDAADQGSSQSLAAEERGNILRSIRDKARMALGLMDRMPPQQRGRLYPTE